MSVWKVTGPPHFVEGVGMVYPVTKGGSRFSSREQDELEALLAGWQPIKTAPKDGSVIQVYAPGFEWPETVRYEKYLAEDAAEIGEHGYWRHAEDLIADCTDSAREDEWTHWAPLPKPPMD